MNSRSLLKESAGLLEIIQRLLDPFLVVASGAALYATSDCRFAGSRHAD